MIKKIILIHLVLILAFTANMALCQENKSDKEKLIELAWQQYNDAVSAVENAKTIEDFKKAVDIFKNAQRTSIFAGIYTQIGTLINYNLGLLYEQTGDFDMASHYLTMYICSTPPPEDSAEVKKMIDEIDYKAKQFINPETLQGTWYFSVPKESSEPRLEIRINNGIIEARCLSSESSQEMVPNGGFIPAKWDPSGKSLVVTDAPYYTCDKSVNADNCPHKITLNLLRTAENKLEGDLTDTGIVYQDINNPEMFTSSGKVVFERTQ